MIKVERLCCASLDGGNIQGRTKCDNKKESNELWGLLQDCRDVHAIKLEILDVEEPINFPKVARRLCKKLLCQDASF